MRRYCVESVNYAYMISVDRLSIHKSQGQTLERVKVDMGEIFEAGQGYVALSRATRLESLQVIRFRPEKYVT